MDERARWRGSRSRGGQELTRRQLLRGSAMAMVLGACGDDLLPRRAAPGGWQTPELPPVGPEGGLFPDEVAEAPLSSFPLGVASGDVGEEATLWTQYRGLGNLMLAVWQVLPDESYSDLVIWTRVQPGGDGLVHVEVGRLEPGARHVFAFVEMRDQALVSRSPLGAFRAALADDAHQPLRLGASSCTQHGFALDTLTHAAGRGDLDLYLLLGDTMYSGNTTTRDGFRSRWARDLSTSGYRQLRQSTSVLSTWDDHEVANNWDPETLEAAVFGEAASAFLDHLPVGRAARQAGRLWRKTRWGRTAEIFVLDTRSERRPSTRLGLNAQYLSRAQMDWLKSGLAASPCTFKLIMNSVPITNFPSAFDVVSNDRWEGYWEARHELLSFIDNERIGGVLWLSGDFHFASCGRVSPSGPGANAVELLVGPGAQTPNPLWALLVDDPQFDFASGTNNYAVLDLEPRERKATVTYHDGAGAAFATRAYTL